MKLNALSAARLKTPGYYGDGNGLWLQITSLSAKSWIFRFTSPVTGRAREMGLGSFSTYSLAEARDLARFCRQTVSSGRDPIIDRHRERETNRAAAARVMTFDQCAEAYVTAHRSGWKNEKHAAQWTATLKKYASPVLGGQDIATIDIAAILRVIEPIWTTKNETASRLRGRIEAILDWATVRSYRSGLNPARWKGHLDSVLPAPAKIQRLTKKHHAAIPYASCPELFLELTQQSGMACRALEVTILTAARSGEIRLALWSEIDFSNRIWIIPATRMKAGKEHRVPLSSTALRILENLSRDAHSSYIFPGQRGGPLSDMSLSAVLRRMERPDLTVHGFRSTFRDWAGETTAFPREVIEHALAHQLKDKAEAAYQRGDLLVKRSALMQAWADYLVRS